MRYKKMPEDYKNNIKKRLEIGKTIAVDYGGYRNIE